LFYFEFWGCFSYVHCLYDPIDSYYANSINFGDVNDGGVELEAC